jgi:hypothetical protein
VRRRRALAIWSTVVLVALVLGIGAGMASNRWGCWRYVDNGINWFNGATGDYWDIYDEEAKADADSWNRSTTIALSPVTGAGSSDHINAYNGFYGINGWLGLAEIRSNWSCYVFEGRARLNMSYLEGGYSRTEKKHVACQEVGHLFGLDHNRNASSTCMNDTILSAPQPDSHDIGMVNSIYVCNGSSGGYQGCRGNGCEVCAEKVALYPLYFKNHPNCSENATCGGQFFTCNSACPAPSSADMCNGTSGQWAGCRGNGCAVCAEKLADYPCYFRNHPYCKRNDTCDGQFFTCNSNCPAPTDADRC